jgi:hypothetical protein
VKRIQRLTVPDFRVKQPKPLGVIYSQPSGRKTIQLFGVVDPLDMFAKVRFLTPFKSEKHRQRTLIRARFI